jgi:enoyl-CoA hydratase/carnithine racemase
MHMDFSALTSTSFRLDAGIGWLALNRPESLNALDLSMVSEIETVLAWVRDAQEVRCLVITGSGKGFCAGADLKNLNAVDSPTNLSAFIRHAGRVFSAIESLEKPTIAGINGITLAGGLELALSCDLIVAASTARLGDAHANFGQIPGGGATVRLPSRVGIHRSKYLMLTGAAISAETALQWGLVDEVVAPDLLQTRAGEIAALIVKKSPLVLGRIKALVNGARDASTADALEAERHASDAHFCSHDQREGMAAFAEKREPRYIGE